MGLTFLSRAAKLDAVHRMTEMSGTPASERTQQNRERNWTPAGLCHVHLSSCETSGNSTDDLKHRLYIGPIE